MVNYIAGWREGISVKKVDIKIGYMDDFNSVRCKKN